MSRLSFLSRPHIVLMIGDEGVLAVPCNLRSKSDDLFAASHDERAAEALFDLLEYNPRARVTIFADNLAQDFRREAVPRLNPLDRPKLVARRLKQAFPQAELAASLNCRGDRRHILFAGLHGGGPVFEWLDRIRARCPKILPQIALLPLECSGIASKLAPDGGKGWVLLLSRQRTGGFRQIVTRDGELIFTRLTPPLPLSASAGEVTETVARDIRASLGYLGRLGFGDPGELQAVLLLPENMHAAMKVLSLPCRSLRLLSPHDAAAELGVASIAQSSEVYADRLYAGWLAAKRKARLPLMPPDLRQARRTVSIREWGWRVAAAALLFAVVTTAMQASDLLKTLVDVRQEAIQLADVRENLASEQASAAPITEPLGRLRQAVERRRIFAEPVAMPWDALRMLSPALGDARLVRLEWHGGDKPGSETLQADVKLMDVGANADHPAIVARFQKLEQNVARAMPGYDVRLTRYPFPAMPDEALSNAASGKNAAPDDTGQLTIRKAGS